MLNLPVYLYTPAIRVFIDLDNSTKQGVDKMYHGYATIAKGLKNTLRFNFVNGDQRPVNVNNMEFEFKIFNPVTNNQVLPNTVNLTILDNGTTLGLRGQAQVTLTPADTVYLTPGHYTYSIVKKNGVDLSPVFLDGASSMTGNIEITDGIVPKFIASEELTFALNQNNLRRAGPIASNRDGRGSNALHTAQLYFTNFTGNLKVFASLDNSMTNPNWAQVSSIDYTNQTGTTFINLEDMSNVNYFKFEYVPTAGSIDKVLYRS